MSHNDMIRLAPLSDSDPLAAKVAYYAYHGLRAIRDVVAQQGYILSDYLVDPFNNQPMGLEPAEFAVVVLMPSIQLEWAAMDWLAEEYVRVVANACKKISLFHIIRYQLKVLLLTLMLQSPTSSRIEQPAPHPHPPYHTTLSSSAYPPGCLYGIKEGDDALARRLVATRLQHDNDQRRCKALQRAPAPF
jgi:hypothetical protein